MIFLSEIQSSMNRRRKNRTKAMERLQSSNPLYYRFSHEIYSIFTYYENSQDFREEEEVSIFISPFVTQRGNMLE